MSLVQFTTQRTYPSSLLHIILKDFLTKMSSNPCWIAAKGSSVTEAL